MRILATLLAVFAVATTSYAAEVPQPAVDAAEQNKQLSLRVEAQISQSFGQPVKVKEVMSLANKQIIEAVLADGSLVHLTPDLTHMVYRGELYELLPLKPNNITKNRNNIKREGLMAALDDKDLVIFKAKGEEKTVINVFTDIDCGYCRKLHNEVARLNDLGITVRYLAYPRAGVTDRRTGQLTSSFKKIKSVWCDENRAEAMTAAKKNRTIKDNLDCDAPIAEHIALGYEVGVSGTPAIVLQDGRFIGGYMAADELAKTIGLN
ncbi:MAG: thioredoxin fold domain-containing protein [Oleispira antarctica]|uniref:Thiol:disulfide interchange protein n=1 Tax=Oleispira antarctica RB-8 TaxID=698738 RepID=R4YTJ6_OLEAN|nr:thioredoxin fold domain-containing protein [Oleispira antarctica]MBQ0793106.1 thioredoxin fold domain-containing protein [Oleispira antarctica]CCK77053.1 Thiol:disulfide interchange protein DsbC [Oleispira antarctica RB-8]|tara:strand:+ start:376 stop:1167 length:792 start_codon:yes stop_codon:yes gene_type:complete